MATDKLSIKNPGSLPVIIFECGTYKQMVIAPSQTTEVELSGVLAVGAEAEQAYYESLNGFNGLKVTADSSSPVNVSINNPGKIPVIIFDCGRYKQMVIDPGETETIAMNGVPFISVEEQKEYYMNLNGFQGLEVTEVVTPTTGSIEITVQKSSDSSPISGATVTASGLTFPATNGSGVTTATNVNPGSVNVTVAASGYTSKQHQVTVTAGQTAKATVKLDAVPTTGSIKITVQKEEDSSPIQGATITGSGVTFAATGADGTSTATNVAAGQVTLTVAAAGYTQKEQQVTVTAGETVEQTVKLAAASV